MSDDKIYKIKYKGVIYDVNKDLYNEYYRTKRKIRYFEYDIKAEKIEINDKQEKVEFSSGREDSYDRLEDKGIQFTASDGNTDVLAEKHMLYEKMGTALNLLNDDEMKIINELFFIQKSERKLSIETGIHHMTIHSRKEMILKKLKNLMKI